MNLRCIILKISIGICFLPYACLAQHVPFDTLKFYTHLKHERLFPEQIIFNKNLQKKNAAFPFIVDSLKEDLAVIYFQLNLLDLCKNMLLSVSDNFSLSEKQNRQYLSLLLVNKEYRVAKKMADNSFFFNMGGTYQKDMSLSIAILKRELTKNDSIYNSFTLSPILFEIKNRYLNPPYYSPVIAGISSALVPGLGKLYIGNRNQAITAFVANLLLGLQTVESYVKSGSRSPRFFITAGLFSVFYTGNIIGSISMAKKKKVDYFKQIDYEIFNYYSTDIYKSLD